MSGIGVIQSGINGLAAGVEQAQRAANDITLGGTVDNRGNSNLSDLAESSVDLLEAKLQTQASAKLIDTGESLIGTLIDLTI